jgi:16S rRNA (guanine527-N7)-methyltransferase
VTDRPSLADGAHALGVALDAEQLRRIDAYLDAVLEINRTLNLTSVRERDEAVVRHLLDSLSVVPIWHALAGEAPPRRVLDLGTGGGFPGAVLAVAWPKTRVTMIDSTGKKVRAVVQCLATAGIANARAIQVRGEQMPTLFRDARRSFDLCVARAVGKADHLVREFAPLVSIGGRIFLMKGPNTADDEISAAAREAKRLDLVVGAPRTTDVPGLERRMVLVYERR